jgi:hypothetical protein
MPTTQGPSILRYDEQGDPVVAYRVKDAERTTVVQFSGDTDWLDSPMGKRLATAIARADHAIGSPARYPPVESRRKR